MQTDLPGGSDGTHHIETCDLRCNMSHVTQGSKAGRCPDPPKAEGLWKPIRFEVGVQRLGPAGFWRSTVLGPPKAAVLGGDDRDRTDDPLLAKQVLSQLSYAPKARSVSKRAPAAQDRRAKRAGPTPKAARVGGPGRI